MAARVEPRLLEQQVVVAALPDRSGQAAMDPEVHLAWLDVERRALCLREANVGDGGSVRTGPEHMVDLAAAVEVATPQDGVIQVLGQGGRLLAQMHAESGDDARAWAAGLRALVGTGAGPALPPEGGAAAQDLHEKSSEMQRRISGLEHITRRRDQQLTKMHGRLQGAMEMLSAVQEMCNQQRVVIQAQTEAVEILEREGAGAPNMPGEADGGPRQNGGEEHATNAGATSAADLGGPTSDLDAEDAEEEAEKKAEKMLALLRQADQMQQLLGTLMKDGDSGLAEPEPAPRPFSSAPRPAAAARSSPTAPAPSPAEEVSEDDEDDEDEDEDGDEATAAELMERLQTLEAEKRRFEGMLQSSMQEQQDMEQRLTDMRSLMSSLQSASQEGGD